MGLKILLEIYFIVLTLRDCYANYQVMAVLLMIWAFHLTQHWEREDRQQQDCQPKSDFLIPLSEM